MPATDLKIGTFVLIPNFNTQKGISKKLQPLQKGPYQIIDKPTEVTYKLTDSNKKKSFNTVTTCYLSIQKSTHSAKKLNYLLSQVYTSFKTIHQRNKIKTLIPIKFKKQSNSKTQILKYQTNQNRKNLKKKEKN